MRTAFPTVLVVRGAVLAVPTHILNPASLRGSPDRQKTARKAAFLFRSSSWGVCPPRRTLKKWAKVDALQAGAITYKLKKIPEHIEIKRVNGDKKRIL